jgi:hypothetical protein
LIRRRAQIDTIQISRNGLFASSKNLFKEENRHHSVKYWKIIADKLSKSGWSWGCVSAADSRGRTIFVADAHRGDGQRFIVCADEKLTTFVQLDSAIRGCADGSPLNHSR